VSGFYFGAIVLAVAVVGIRLTLSGVSKSTKASEQAFLFHALRDELQVLAAERVLSSDSLVYQHLMKMLNLGIKNAGIMTVRDLLVVYSQLSAEAKGSTAFQDAVEKCDPKTKNLAGRCFLAFSQMLIANDWVVRTAVQCAKAIRIPGVAYRAITKTASQIFPQRSQAVREARLYREWAQRLSPVH
jgi:hypothetical protein